MADTKKAQQPGNGSSCGKPWQIFWSCTIQLGPVARAWNRPAGIFWHRSLSRDKHRHPLASEGIASSRQGPRKVRGRGFSLAMLLDSFAAAEMMQVVSRVTTEKNRSRRKVTALSALGDNQRALATEIGQQASLQPSLCCSAW
mmetsp:Transcript_28004/g.50586  ORF Transcript_28004/g.50586 Transcript_28004/m.50586 type:complete len:143 (+) Transcript_28004:99-527(+)